VRLVNGRSLCSGRVEVYPTNGWTAVCDADFDWQDAEVVCRELDCGVPAAIHRGAHFGEGQGSIWSKQFQCQGQESLLHSCSTSAGSKQSCSHSSDVGLTCTGYTGFRLVNGTDSCSGRVELRYYSEWGTVCGHYWDLRDASALCRQLNCGFAVAAPGQARFGEGSGSIWADVFECQGNETQLSKCPVSTWERGPCSHGDDAGVVCSVRLSGGESRCAGRVEVYYSRTWGRVLQDSWGSREASVLCRQLGCGSAVEVYNSSLYGTGDSDLCLTGIQCSGNESHLGNCSSPQTLNCSSRHGVAVLCSDHRSLRLVGGDDPCAGRLEVYHSGSWGMVCDDSWDLADSQVVCRQLQCGTALRAPVPASLSQGTGPIWLDEVGCLGNESSLWECPSAGWGQHDCGYKEYIAVMCSEFKQLRLADQCSGPLEVFYNGVWGSVCTNNMDSSIATVVCRELGCGDQGSFSETRSRLGSGAPKWLDNVHCQRWYSTLWQCPSSLWNQTNCEDYEVAEITCSEPLDLRLTGPDNCSGRVEVRYEGSWGTVCDDSWDLQDAQVVCRQLGCGDPVSIVGERNSSFGRGNGTIWLDEVTCRGSELHLWDCWHTPMGQSDCRHKEDAGVICAGESGQLDCGCGLVCVFARVPPR
ncbi:C163A protein, partial [Amia calva]|nr:C163A protein [Amia calva]